MAEHHLRAAEWQAGVKETDVLFIWDEEELS